MKKELKLGFAATLVGTLLLGASATVFAEQVYDGPTEAKVDSDITFTEDTEPGTPVDPTDPEKPISPVDPINPAKGEFVLTYASNLRFGTQKKTDASWQALSDKIQDGEEEVPFAPFVSVKDTRGAARKGWVLTAKQDAPFISSSVGKAELKGAELILSNFVVADSDKAPTPVKFPITLSSEAQDVLSANEATGTGNWSVGLGKLKAGETEGKMVTTGVNLTVPWTSAKDSAAYSTTVTWELIADPTVSE